MPQQHQRRVCPDVDGGNGRRHRRVLRRGPRRAHGGHRGEALLHGRCRTRRRKRRRQRRPRVDGGRGEGGVGGGRRRERDGGGGHAGRRARRRPLHSLPRRQHRRSRVAEAAAAVEPACCAAVAGGRVRRSRRGGGGGGGGWEGEGEACAVDSPVRRREDCVGCGAEGCGGDGAAQLLALLALAGEEGGRVACEDKLCDHAVLEHHADGGAAVDVRDAQSHHAAGPTRALQQAEPRRLLLWKLADICGPHRVAAAARHLRGRSVQGDHRNAADTATFPPPSPPSLGRGSRPLCVCSSCEEG
eukprot:Rhum_TRINITY_DN12880_c0_g1::Rhum_TRINITY_DN12880_c0_g1_i1::g.55075::m.55075